jgi:photosystem II stability/assembly factor-like uncharacterized protein
MKKVIYSILVLIIVQCTFKIENCSAQWFQLNSGTTSRIESIFVTGANTAYFTAFNSSSYSTINSKTTNGGINWFQFANSTIGGSCVYFINANTGFLSGFNLQITTNAGSSWTPAYTSTDTAVVLAFHFPTTSIGYGVGMRVQLSPMLILGSLLLKTTNGGFNWTRLAPPISGSDMELNDVFFIDANTGYTVGWGPTTNIFLKTTNGGNNWSSISSGIGSEAYSIHFTLPNTGYICGQNGIYKTFNGGVNWYQTHQDKANELYFVNANTGYALCWNGIVKTTNAGDNWFYQNYTFPDFLSIMFYDANTGYATGKNGEVIKTTNGGSVFVSQISSTVPDKFSLSQNYPNPFNPTTNIKFQVKYSNVVKLVVFDMLGKEVATLVNEKLAPGTYEATFNGSNLTSGVYFYKLSAGDYSETKKMLLIK